MSAIRDRLPGVGRGRPRAVRSHRSAPEISGAFSAAVSRAGPTYCSSRAGPPAAQSQVGPTAPARRLAWLRNRNWSRDAGELAACFTVHARDLFGHACVLADADRDLAGDLVQATFEAAAGAWCTLRDLPADQCHDWLRDTLAAAAQRQTGHPAGRAVVSPSHRRLTELKTARFRSDYDAAAGLERFAGWLRTRAPGPPGDGSDQPAEAPADSPPGMHWPS